MLASEKEDSVSNEVNEPAEDSVHTENDKLKINDAHQAEYKQESDVKVVSEEEKV